MCGIAGYLGSATIPSERIGRCLEAMRRRGPDQQNVDQRSFEDGNQLVLLHSRLQIIDLDPRSNQPFRYEDHTISFNGELYNYIEVRQALEREGVPVRTKGDTEVLVAALTHWGIEALERCEGMWAFALFDDNRRVLTICRDRFGEKPLYLMEASHGVFFGSEIKFLAALLGKPLEVEYEHLYRYMVNGYKSLGKRDGTFYRGVRQLPAGSLMEVKVGERPVQRRYWEPTYAPDAGMSYEDAVQGVRQALLDSVRLRLRADVPVAFCLSGGVDSSSLVATAKRVLGAHVHAFTLANDDERYDERRQVERVVSDLGLEHTMVPISSRGFRERLPELIRYHDAPLYTVTSYVQWLLLEQIAARGYRVVLTGLGADELLSGYYDHHNMYLHEVHDSADYAESKRAWHEHVEPIVRNPHLQDPELFITDGQFRDHIFLNSRTFASFLRRDWYEAFEEQQYASSLMRNRMLNELRHESVPAILHEDDANSMFFSLENRAPFLSRSFCEFCNRIPTKHLIRDGRTKAPLRDAMAGIVPDTVLHNRNKIGFNAPITSLLDLQDPETRDWILDRGPIFEHVRRDRIESLLSVSRVPNSTSKFLFNFVCSKVFLDQNSESGV